MSAMDCLATIPVMLHVGLDRMTVCAKQLHIFPDDQFTIQYFSQLGQRILTSYSVRASMQRLDMINMQRARIIKSAPTAFAPHLFKAKRP